MGKQQKIKQARRQCHKESEITSFFEKIKKSPHVPQFMGFFMRDSVLIDASAVSDYYFETSGKEMWDTRTDFPNVVPPYRHTFVEFRAKEKEYQRLIKRWAIYARPEQLERGIEGDSLGHAVRCVLFVEMGANNQLPIALAQIDYQVGKDGSLAHCNERPIMRTDLSPYAVPYIHHLSKSLGVSIGEAEKTFIGGYIKNLLGPYLLTTSFLHCKNVELIAPNNSDNKPSTPYDGYRTLNIEAMKHVLKTEGESEEKGLKRALHICRGHFATYTDEKPLFGEVSGTFWILQHLKGCKTPKDYRERTHQ